MDIDAECGRGRNILELIQHELGYGDTNELRERGHTDHAACFEYAVAAGAEHRRVSQKERNAVRLENLKGGEESREMARRSNGGEARDPTPPLLLAARQGDHELFEAIYTGILRNASDAGQLEEATSQLEEFLGMVLGTIEPSSVASPVVRAGIETIVSFLERQPFQGGIIQEACRHAASRFLFSGNA